MPAFQSGSPDGTGFPGLSIDNDRTGPAGTFTTAILSSVEIQIFPQEPQQTLILICEYLTSIDAESICHSVPPEKAWKHA
jgi:hypothetical protein